ncbi:hypothetical protein PAPYR_8463 [Paratrimastix pyriformis]|uniref:Uncharacterized protein n=1 Tax=Paratrimastix pyriformis TaxID=342808 RepID=A0ABQ8UER3_9EUKA|nr:hypothetical protein PAPYR_8463 [Paratrimastix pyriformis]
MSQLTREFAELWLARKDAELGLESFGDEVSATDFRNAFRRWVSKHSSVVKSQRQVIHFSCRELVGLLSKKKKTGQWFYLRTPESSSPSFLVKNSPSRKSPTTLSRVARKVSRAIKNSRAHYDDDDDDDETASSDSPATSPETSPVTTPATAPSPVPSSPESPAPESPPPSTPEQKEAVVAEEPPSKVGICPPLSLVARQETPPPPSSAQPFPTLNIDDQESLGYFPPWFTQSHSMHLDDGDASDLSPHILLEEAPTPTLPGQDVCPASGSEPRVSAWVFPLEGFPLPGRMEALDDPASPLHERDAAPAGTDVEYRMAGSSPGAPPVLFPPGSVSRITPDSFDFNPYETLLNATPECAAGSPR